MIEQIVVGRVILTEADLFPSQFPLGQLRARMCDSTGRLIGGQLGDRRTILVGAGDV